MRVVLYGFLRHDQNGRAISLRLYAATMYIPNLRRGWAMHNPSTMSPRR